MKNDRPASEKSAVAQAQAEFLADVAISNPPSLPFVVQKMFAVLEPAEIMVLLDASDEDLLDDVMCTGFELKFPAIASQYLGAFIGEDEATDGA